MSPKELRQLVSRLEAEAASRPWLYKLRVVALALLGYAYLLLILAFSVGLPVLFILGLFTSATAVFIQLVLKLAIPLLALAAVIVRSLWVRIPAPVGIPLRKEQAPALFETALRLSRDVRAPQVHDVILDGSFNASVVQIPRLGVLGWSRNYLTVGLPLMDALTPEQFEAVLAHELGHLGRAHGRFRAWIYRLRTSWTQLAENLRKQGQRSWFIFARFFNWYGPLFGAYTLVLARSQEYSADRHSADAVGPTIAANALTAVAVGAQIVATKFWPSLLRIADTQPSPPFQPFTELERNLGEGFLDGEAKKALEAILTQKANPSNTHPPLRDRLAALGEEARLPGPIKKSAAEHFVGKALVDLRQALNRRWESQVTASWQARYDQACASREKLDQLTEKSRVEKLSAQEMWQMAMLTEAFRGVDAAVPLYQQILIKNENHAPANFAIGRIFLSREDFNGVPMIEQAMDLSSDLVPVGCALIQGFLWQHDREDEAEAFYRRAKEHERIVALAALERRRIHRRDRFIETGLDEATIAPIREELSNFPEVAKAYLVRKEVTYFPERFLFVLGVVPRFTEVFRLRSRTSQGLAKRLASKMTLPCLVVVLRAGWATKRMKRVNRAEIYSRRKAPPA